MAVSAAAGKDLVISGFDGELKAGHERAWKGQGVSWVRGVNRRALRCHDGGFAVLGSDVGFHSAEGSLDFWVRTDWDGNDGLTHAIVSVGTKAGLRLAKTANDRLTVVWQPIEGLGALRVGVDISKDWPAHQWRHVALTWKENLYSLYLDGEKRSAVEPEQPMPALRDTRPLVLGGPKSVSADLAVDLFILRDQALSPEQVTERFTRGMSALEREQDARLVMRALVGSRPATLVLDTGSSMNALWQSFAQKAGVEARPSYRGANLFEQEAKAQLVLPNGNAFTQNFAILESTAGDDSWEGLVGWPNFFEANRLRVMWERRTMRPMSADEVKVLGDGWQSVPVKKGAGVLKLGDTQVIIDDTELTLPVIVDTGDGTGLSLTRGTWSKHAPAWADCPKGYQMRWTPSGGVQPRVAVLAREVQLFGHTLKDVSVEEDSHGAKATEGEGLRIGLAALSWFEVVIDGVEGQLWLKPRAKAAVRGIFNPSGLLFGGETGAIRLLVAPDSPAWKHGLRTGDEILQWENVPIAKGETGMDMHMDIQHLLNAGKAVKLRLRRGGETLEIQVAKRP